MARDASRGTGSGTIDIRVLGPVEVRRDDADVNVGHHRQRLVLALLAAQAGVVTSTNRLIEQLWQERPPLRARDTLYSYLSRLRKLFDGTDVSIERRPGGYVLDADPAIVDMHRFRDLVARARRSGSIVDWDAAVKLWRGEPFADFDVPQLDQLRTTLDAEHFAVVLDRNDALLAHREHALLLPGLRQLSGQHPWDERLAGQLMLALYRSGRPSEAQDHYLDFRRRLIDERGTQPGTELADLHRSMLNEDPGIAGPAAVDDTHRSEAVTPRQLPCDLTGFTGRQSELDSIDELRSTGTRCVVISGTAGVGKTTLAVHWAHRAAERFPDGQLYVNLRGFDPSGQPLSPNDVVRTFLGALGVPADRIPLGEDAQVALYRSLVAQRRLLVVLDNAVDAEQVRPLLPGGSECLTLVTSRDQLAGLVITEGAMPVVLNLFSENESHELLSSVLGAGRLAGETEPVADIIRRCGGLPLALAIVAARTRLDPGEPLARLARRIEPRDGDLDPADSMTDIQSVFSWSYRLLSRDAARLFRRLSVHPGPGISMTAAASLLGEPPESVRPLLDELLRAHLIAKIPSGQFTVHDLMSAYSRKLAVLEDSREDCRAALERLLDQYLHAISLAFALADTGDNTFVASEAAPGTALESESTIGDGMDWFSTEVPVLTGLVAMAFREGLDSHVCLLVQSIERHLDRLDLRRDWMACQQLALQAATRAGNRSGQAHVHKNLGLFPELPERYGTADEHLARALELFEELGDEAGQASAHLGFGLLLNGREQPEAAMVHEKRACELFASAGNISRRTTALNNLGWTLAKLGDYGRALRYCKEALDLASENGVRYNLPYIWDSLGFIHAGLRDQTSATTCYERAIALSREVGDVFEEAMAMSHLGDAFRTFGDVGNAIGRYRQAVAILDGLESRDSQNAETVREKLRTLEEAVAALW